MKWITLIIVFYSLSFAQLYDPLFEVDFENGIGSSWNPQGDLTILNEDRNHYLHCDSWMKASPSISLTYKSYEVAFKFRVTKGSLSLNLRHSKLNGQYQNYSINFSEYTIDFSKKYYNMDSINIKSEIVQINDDEWYDVKVNVNNDAFKIYLNNEVVVDTIDSTNPILSGHSYFVISAVESEISIDNVTLTGIMNDHNATWVSTGGPFGGNGYDVRINPDDPDIMYVTDIRGGNYKTTNGGFSWYPINTGIEFNPAIKNGTVPVHCLSLDPNNNNKLWCGTAGLLGVFLSTDEGETWVKKDNGFPEFEWGASVRGITVQPGNSDVIFCGLEVVVNPIRIPEGKTSPLQGAIFKTTDGGENWYKVYDSEALVRHIVINPRNPDTMYASTGIFNNDCIGEEGVLKGTDGGETWFHRNAGLSDVTICGLYMDNNNPQTLWASTGREPVVGGAALGQIYKTTNGGDSWEKLYETGWPIGTITVSPVNSDIVFAVNENYSFLTTDGGSAWIEKDYRVDGLYPGIPAGIVAHPRNENTFFVNTCSGGVFATFDQGVSWQTFGNGYSNAEMHNLLIDQNNVNSVFATSSTRLALTTNGGVNWSPAGYLEAVDDGPVGEAMLLEPNPLNSGTVYTGANYGPHLSRTYDKQKWEYIYDFSNTVVFDEEGIGAIAISPADTNVIFVGIRTTNLPFVEDRTGVIFDQSTFSDGILRSTDGGTTWNESNSGLEWTTENIQAIKFDPVNHETMYTAIYGYGIFKSTDAGELWYYSGVGILPAEITSLEIDPVNTNNIYVGTERGGLYRSANAGIIWEKKTTGIPAEGSIRSIAIDPANSDNVYAGDYLSGVYKSTDAVRIGTSLTMDFLSLLCRM